MKRTLFMSFLLVFLAIGILGQATVVPVVELKYRGLMGGIQNGRWVAPARVAPGMKSEAEFVLVGWNGVEEGGVTFGKKSETEDVCQDFTRMEFDLTQDHGIAIGSAAKWNPVPRRPTSIDLNNAAYKMVVTNFLKRKGILRPTVRIREAFRVDLEGDGVEEVVLSATYYKTTDAPDADVGDYSFVMLRKATGKVVTDHLLEGEFYPKRVVFAAPNEHHVSAIADLNGDGKMEVVLYGFYYEGEFSTAWEMRKGRPVKIKEFEIGCGV